MYLDYPVATNSCVDFLLPPPVLFSFSNFIHSREAPNTTLKAPANPSILYSKTTPTHIQLQTLYFLTKIPKSEPKILPKPKLNSILKILIFVQILQSAETANLLVLNSARAVPSVEKQGFLYNYELLGLFVTMTIIGNLM